jgi:hypothetical protein
VAKSIAPATRRKYEVFPGTWVHLAFFSGKLVSILAEAGRMYAWSGCMWKTSRQLPATSLKTRKREPERR